jgi:Cu/Ag efflux protein CusF
MRKSIITAALAATLVSTTAFAATATGSIKGINPAKHQLTLASGKVYDLPTSWQSNGFKVGDKVKITYQVQNGKMMASAVTHAS